MPRLGLIQMRCEKGAVEENLAATHLYYKEALARGARFVAFPEMSITGYIDPGLHPRAVLRLDGPEVARVVAFTLGEPAALIAGFVEENPAGKPFITQVVAAGGRLLGFYRKRTIVDDEAAWFDAGDEAPVFTHAGVPFGVAICADIGNRAVFAGLAAGGARIVFEVAAPGLYGEQATRNWASGYAWWQGECTEHLGSYARDLGLWIAVATQAGRTVDEDFPGGGYLFAPDGARACATADWLPGVLYVNVSDLTSEGPRCDECAKPGTG